MGLPGLAKEVSKICHEIGIPNVNDEFVPTKAIKEAISSHHYSDMKKDLESSSKLEEIKHEEFREPQKYMHERSIENGRLAFQIRSKMVKDIPANFKNKFKKDSEGLKCKYCTSDDILSQSHCLVCPAWQELRVGLDMKQIKDLTIFFRKMLLERARLDVKRTKA